MNIISKNFYSVSGDPTLSCSLFRGLTFAFFCLVGSVALLHAQKLEGFEHYFSKSSLGSVKTRDSQTFRVQWVHPRDEVFVSALLEHLEAAHTLLKTEFHVPLKAKVPVEIFPDLKSFADVSKLSLARFKATGTIALTLDQRLMILSPRNLTSGYSWAITVVHEFIHYLIREISPDHIPIWLHEGTAQYFQGYPYQTKMVLTPAQWGLFRKMKMKNALLDLETLKEPFPYRKTAEEAELAYIQSLLFTQWLQSRCGVLNLIQTTANFKSIDKALEQCTGWTKDQLQKNFFTQILSKIEIPQGKDVLFYARDFSGDDALEVEGRKIEKRTRDFAQLANEMYKQGRYRGHLLEMKKISSSGEVMPPSWRRQIASSHLKLNEVSQAREVLKGIVADYPEDAGAWYLLGKLDLTEKKVKSGWENLLRAFFVNPFIEDLPDQMRQLQESQSDLKFRL